MGKKKHKERSRSQSRERDRHKGRKHKKKRSYSSSDDSSDYESDHQHHKKHKHKSRSRSRDRQRDKSRLTAEEVQLLKEERRKQKDLAKAIETPEEKRARRLAKKEAKERTRKAKMGWDEEYMGYTNMDNPFGDEHLLDTFVWKQKLEKEGKDISAQHEIEKQQKSKMIENKLELEKVKKRRLEREHEREEMDKEREMLQREKEAEYYNAWEKQEDKFHLQQAKLRSKIRIEDGRAKPIDLLGKYINAEDDDMAGVEMHEPYTYLNGLTIADLEDLIEDIKVYMELEDHKNVEYWRDITTITEDELAQLRKIDPTSSTYVGDRRTGINQSVSDDVVSIFKGKTLSQLQLLETSIKNKVKGGQGIDIGYWESLSQQLKAHMARSRLREKHQEQLRRKLFKLKQEQGITESAPLFPIIIAEKGTSSPVSVKKEPSASPGPSTSQGESSEPLATGGPPVEKDAAESTDTKSDLVVPSSSKSDMEVPGTSAEGEIDIGNEDNDRGMDIQEADEQDNSPVITEEDLMEASFDDYDAGQYSPRLLRPSELEPDTILYEEEDDKKRLEFARKSLLSTGKAKKDSDLELVQRARLGMSGEEAQFSVLIPLETQSLIWSDKYRPRKPRFFNRVHTGFEWNKYNQTHYDIDNPPPKIVQGYKFNIFYPDLIDKSNPPTYTLTPLEENKDFTSLRFSAGPPYEDIAFKIVNREWEYSYKKGFRCQFHNNIFQLWFHFKRYRYRR